MMHISLDLLYVEKKLISLRVGDPRLQEILNVFQILGQELSEIILILHSFKSFSEQSTKSCYETYLIGLEYESNESPAVPRYPSIVTW